MAFTIRRGLAALAVLAGLLSCNPADTRAAEKTTDMRITSTAFTDGQPIPMAYTCQGNDRSPPLAFADVPAGAKSLALVVDDPDAPDPAAPKVVWVHWVLANLPATAGGLPGAVAPKELPRGTVQGQNDWKRLGYGGPCPPIGRHRYFFKLYALDAALGVSEGVSKTELERVMEGHVLAQATLIGTYTKGK